MPSTDNLAPIRLEIVDGAEHRYDEDGWEHNAYTVRLTRGDESMKVPWRQGLGITDDPNAADVLEALLSDAASYINARGFEDWATDLGFDTDSRKAYAIYQQTEEQTEQLRDLLGEDFDAAVFPTEADDYDNERVAKRLTEES